MSDDTQKSITLPSNEPADLLAEFVKVHGEPKAGDVVKIVIEKSE